MRWINFFKLIVMRKIFFILIIATFSVSCATKRRLTKLSMPVVEAMERQSAESSHFYKFDFSKLDDFSKPVEVIKRKSKVIPLLIVYSWEKDLLVQISPKIVANQFEIYFSEMAKNEGLEQKLNGRRLEITIEQIPNTFSYFEDSTLLFFLLGYYQSYHFDLKTPSNNQFLKIKYRIIDENTLPADKNITILSKNNSFENENMSKKRLIHNYMMDFRQNISVMAKETLDKIISEL